MPIYHWELPFLLALNEWAGPLGIGLAGLFTFLGNQEFYLLLIPLFVWSLHPRTGIRLAAVYLLSVYLNTGVKALLDHPRPFELEPGLIPADPEAVYAVGRGMPSGHAQWSMTIWLMMAAWIQKYWAWGVALLMTLLIGFSRVVLGVHFLSQVAAGWVLGAAVFGLAVGVQTPLENWLSGLSRGMKVMLAVVLPVGLIFLFPAPDNLAAMAVLSGLGIGLAFWPEQPLSLAAGSWWQKGLRYLVGIVVLLAIYLGLSALFPAEGEALYLPFRAVRYALLGLWISTGAPWLFGRTYLLTREVRLA